MKEKPTPKIKKAPRQLLERLEENYQRRRRVHKYLQLFRWTKSKFIGSGKANSKKYKNSEVRRGWRRYEYLAK